ncbi:prostaglandin G/H synthase 1-like [Acyrthosiphon pisum]|uniref:Uncharacterized protein n=1 Tax=Acyrthosiphon pisum TaxID=7029 RepID=A0A8R2JX86_ACYPI|nr:prostaglandin G/H synthase 1-like [Acyrthosiphon pisum]
MSTLWVREHNRVCDELSRKSPSWTDEQLYTTARKVVTGQMMTIMMKEILNVELRPEVNHHRMENISGSGTPIELYLTMAVSSLPENQQVSEAGLKDALKFMGNSKIGMFTAHNDDALTEYLTRTLMTISREHCIQGFNNYRRLLGLPAYNSFFDLTGNNETATELKNLYSTVEDVELLTGVLTERSISGVLPTAKVLSNSFVITAILTNNITAKHSWVPDTFGDVELFNLVKSASLKSLVYRNVDVNRD